MIIGHFAPALGGEHEHRGYAAVDVRPAVALGCAGLGRERVELTLDRVEVLRQRFEPVTTFVEGQFSEVGPADRLGMLEHGLEVEPGTRDGGYRFAGDCGLQDAAVAVTGNPLIPDQVG